MILPAAAGPLGVFLMRQFASSIPDRLLEAARVDGASEFYIFQRIVLPLSASALAATGSSRSCRRGTPCCGPDRADQRGELHAARRPRHLRQGPVPGRLRVVDGGAVVLVLPVIIVFLFLQKRFTQSVAMTGLKG